MSDPRGSIESIRPLVTHENATGSHLVVTFTCPVSRKSVNARYTVPQSSGIAAAVGARVQQSAWYEVRRQVHSLVRSALGTSSVGRIASDAVTTAMGTQVTYTSSQKAAGLTGAARDAAVVEAFRSVSSQFAWAGDRWVHGSAAKDLISPMDKQLQDSALTSKYDRTVGARMLVEVASCHGGISAEEASHLEEVLDPEVGSLAALQNRPPLTRAELNETTKGSSRTSLLSLAWTLALVDERFDDAEETKLATLADGLGLPAAERDRARDIARGWVLDQAFERAFGWGGHDEHARNEAISLGERIGMTRDEVEVAEARYQRRRTG